MGAAVFLVFFILGMVLATAGGLIGLIDAFRVSPTWGLLAFFIPLALLVFCIKFWGSRKWARVSLLTSLAGMLSMLAGLPFLAGAVRQQIAGLEDAVEDLATDQVPIEQLPPEGSDQGFTAPMVPAAPQMVNIAGTDLIQSTDPEARIQQINSRRTDPFATVPIPPPPRRPPPPVAGGSPTGPASPVGVGGQPTPATPSPGGAASQPSGSAPPPPTPLPPSEIALAPLPPLPAPTQAQAVVVTGVVTIGDRTYAIVTSPDEPTGRYVAAGQWVAGGSVLVKRIDMRGNEPVVVLEQNGVEVSRSVGVQDEPQDEAAAT